MKSLNKIASAGAEINAAHSERVIFDVEDTQIVGMLYFPEDYQSDQQYPAAIVSGSLTSVKEMMSGDYAERLAKYGLVTLAIDHRGYGESGGILRQFEDPAMKAVDLSGAISYLTTRSDVMADSIALLGICTAGGNVLYTAAQDDRVAAVATVAGWFIEPSLTPLLYGSEENVNILRQAGINACEKYENMGKNTLIPAYSDTDQTASHVGPMEYYMDTNRGGGTAQWSNAFSVLSWEPWLAFDPVSRAADVTTPTLIVHSDNAALPDQARKVYDLLNGEKQLYWSEGRHFDFYDDPKHVDEATAVIAKFFNSNI